MIQRAMTGGHTNRGKWSQPGVPHKGWICVGDEDLGEPSEFCGMCESVEIRFVHFMEHPDYADILGVGCICSEHMAEDYVGPRLREAKLLSRVRRRKTWVKRPWKTSAMGNSYLNTEGFNLAVFKRLDPTGEHWALKVTHRESGQSQFGKRRYFSEEAAKSAALDALIWAKDHLATRG
jgi:hypothetical protein